jgi:hypothetical protein
MTTQTELIYCYYAPRRFLCRVCRLLILKRGLPTLGNLENDLCCFYFKFSTLTYQGFALTSADGLLLRRTRRTVPFRRNDAVAFGSTMALAGNISCIIRYNRRANDVF